jgi:hypothetical protein
MTQVHRTKWFLPLVSVVLGAGVCAAVWVGGNVVGAITSFSIIAGVGLAILVLGERSETIRGLRGDGRDERFSLIDMRATALAGNAVILAIIVGFLVEVARSDDGMPYTWLGAIAGVAYIVGVFLGRVRS